MWTRRRTRLAAAGQRPDTSATTSTGCGSSDYPVEAVRGPGGHYRLGVGAKLPPLLLDDDEAVAVAVGLRAVTGISGIEETSARALAKLEAVLPHRLSAGSTPCAMPCRPGRRTPVPMSPDPEVDAGLLMAVAAAIRDHEEIRFALPRRRAAPGRAVPARQLAAALVSGRPRRPHRRVVELPARLDAAADPRRAPIHPSRPARR